MSSNQLMGYGYTSDTDESLQSKAGAKFGLNAGANITKFAFNANVAKEGEPARPAIEIVFMIAGKEFKDWINPITKVYGAGNVLLTDTASQEYINAFNKEITLQRGLITHYLKALGVAEETIAASFQTPVFSFQEFATKVCSLIPAGYEKRPVDVFLEYQYNFGLKKDGTEYDITFPTLPRNMKGGYFVVPAQPGVWNEQRGEDGSLFYINSNGQKHPIEKSADFMESPKGTQQKKETSAAPGAANPMNGAPIDTTPATPAQWTQPGQ